MSYKKSRARREFEQNSNGLLSLARKISYKNVNLLYEHKNLIYQSSIVLLCSSVEQYLRTYVEDLFFGYKSGGATLAEIPINPRTFSFFNRQRVIYEGFIQTRDEANVLEKLNLSNKELYSILDDTQVFDNHIDPKTIVNDKKYPKPKNLKTLYNRLGVKNIFSEASRLGHKDYELMLRSFLDTRETIAHQQSIDLTFEDIKRNFENITDLIDKLDRVAYRHICFESGQKYWN